jgi:hypothetical protein
MQILSGLPGDRHRARFRGMMILPVAAARPHQKPAVGFNLPDDFPDFHFREILRRLRRRFAFQRRENALKTHSPPSLPGNGSQAHSGVMAGSVMKNYFARPSTILTSSSVRP